VALGVFIFREYLNAYKIIGIAMAIIGVVLMNYKG
jgi:multidrug transporter EmrE-like cation transporter